MGSVEGVGNWGEAAERVCVWGRLGVWPWRFGGDRAPPTRPGAGDFGKVDSADGPGGVVAFAWGVRGGWRRLRVFYATRERNATVVRGRGIIRWCATPGCLRDFPVLGLVYCRCKIFKMNFFTFKILNID